MYQYNLHHHEKYEGITRIPDERADFDYSFLKNGVKTLSDEIEKQKKDKVVIIISTVLPEQLLEKLSLYWESTPS